MADPVDGIESFETPEDAGKGDRGLVRLWLSALDAADKEEASWRTEAQQTMQRYRQEELTTTGTANDSRQDYFNIPFASVETTVPALYNSVPVPDVRRRFNDKDPIGKYISQITERCLSYLVDSYDFDATMEQAVQDSEIIGRGVTRVRYVPKPMRNNKGEQTGNWDEAICEHVQWAAFRHGPGHTWDDVTWVAFELFWTRQQVDEQFPNLGDKVELDINLIEDAKGEPGQPAPDVFKRLHIWEIWDKGTHQVLFIAPSYKAAPLRVDPDPLVVAKFFPVAPPLYSISTSDSLVPVPPYRTYKHLAEEADLITRRLSNLIACLKWRGIYDARLSEISKLTGLADGEFTPAQDVAELLATGKLEDAIWIMPIDRLILIIRDLAEAREGIKQNIFEITGSADIMRGATDPNETMGAQKMKTQWGSLRLSRRQGAVAAHARDLFRLKSEIIASKFSLETKKLMSGVELPTQAEKQQAQIQMQMQMMQQQAMMAQQRPPGAGAPMPPQGGPPGPPSMSGSPQMPNGAGGAVRPPTAQQGAY